MMYTYIVCLIIGFFCVVLAIETQAMNNMFSSDGGSVNSSISGVLERTRRNLDPPTSHMLFHFKANQTNRFWVWDATNFTCGSTGFCNKTLWTGKPLCSFECNPLCSCDDQCHLFGDCCPDLMFQNSANVPSVASLYVSCLASNWTKWSNFSGVLMVDSCRASSGLSEDVVRKCQEPDNAFQVQATPVITTFENITYRNIFCAQCHGKTDYKGWRHQVTCEDGTKLKGAKSKDELWKLIIASPNNCHIQTFPPDSFSARQCNSNFTRKCNETGKWAEYDPVVEELCALYDHNVEYYGSKTYTAYKNIFCAVCNGVVLNRNIPCDRFKPEELPYPLSVLLDFNPDLKTSTTDSSRGSQTQDNPVCQIGQVSDPLTMACRPIICPDNRVMDGESCVMPYKASTGLGISFSALFKPANDSTEFSALLKPANGSTNFLSYIVDVDYKEILKAALDEFKPLIVYQLTPFIDFSHERLIISGAVISLSSRPVIDLEKKLLSFLSTDFTSSHLEENVTILSSPRLCGIPENLEGYIKTEFTNDVDSFNELYRKCEIENCKNKTAVYLLTLDCPFLEYNMSAGQNFTYNITDNSISFVNLTVFLNDSEVLFCDGTLKLCLDAISYIEDFFVKNQEENNIVKSAGSGTQTSFAMRLVSLVCITLSLIGLLLTFIIYSIVPKLRSPPGINTMALVFHLFFAQLLFLVGNRTENQIGCKVLGVCIHFFWIATFSWMGVSAYHMHSVFARLRPLSKNSRYYNFKYWVVCLVACVVVVLPCILFSLIRSDWDEIGYGGQICFINDPTAIGIFFAGPLGLILLINAVFFILTVIAIQRVPNMSETSNKTNKHHLFVYIRLSLLFGFTWIFGILAAIFNSEVLQYIFIVLTGTQGLFIFVAYCANKRTMDMIKTAIKEHRIDRSSTQSDKLPKYRKRKTTSTTST